MTHTVERSGQVLNVCMFYEENHGCSLGPRPSLKSASCSKLWSAQGESLDSAWQSHVEAGWTATFRAPCGKNGAAVLGLEM